VDSSRIAEILERVNTQGMDALGPEDLIVIADLQSGRAVRSGASAPAAPLDAPEVAVEAPDLNGNLAASGVELDEAPKRSGQDNLRPKTARQPSNLEKIANEITQIAGSARTGEAIAPRQARATWKKVEGLTSEEFEKLVGVIGNEDAALANLEQVQNIAGDAARDPNSLAAAALDRAKQAREGTMRAPGSNSPEFATDNLTDADMPTPADTARAVEAERQLALEDRSVGGGLSLQDRIVLAGLNPADPQAARNLPFWLKGRDRAKSLEGRSNGARAGELSTSDEALLEQAEELKAAVDQSQAELRAAQYELRLAQIARTSGRGGASDADLAQMQQSLAQAQDTARKLLDMEDSLFPPRLVRASDGQPLRDAKGSIRRAPAAMLADPSLVPRGVRVERGVRGATDSWLNRAGQAETYDDLVITMAGARPRAADSLTRSNPAMSAGERKLLENEAVDAFGEDAIEFLPEDQEVGDVADLGGSGKPGKVRGRPLPSRQQAALQVMFAGSPNPIAMMGSAEAVADQIIATHRVFRPGTANFDMARERLVRLIENEFGGPGPRPASSDPAALPGPATARGTSQDPARLPALPGGTNVRVESPTGSPVGEFAPITQSSPPAVAGSTALVPSSPSRPKGLPGPKPDAADVNLESSGVELADEAGDVEDALTDFDRDMPAGARTSGRGQGRGRGGKGKGGKGGAKKDPVVVDADKVELVDPDKPFTANADELRTRVEQSTSSGTQVRDAMKNPPDLRKPKADPNAKPKDGGDGGKPPEDPPKRLEDSDGDAGKPSNKKKPTKADDTKPKDAPGKWLKRGLIAAAGLGTIAALSGGGGGGVAAGGEVPPPVPPSGGPGAAGGEVSEDALERALERIRGSRRGPSSPTYQTLQNWTVWR
jgi:hypothetical protein